MIERRGLPHRVFGSSAIALWRRDEQSASTQFARLVTDQP